MQTKTLIVHVYTTCTIQYLARIAIIIMKFKFSGVQNHSLHPQTFFILYEGIFSILILSSKESARDQT